MRSPCFHRMVQNSNMKRFEIQNRSMHSHITESLKEIRFQAACIEKISVTSPTVTDVPTIELLAGGAKSSFI